MDMTDPEVQEKELAWVRLTERGAVQVNHGQLAVAEESWQRACDIAECFIEGDARRAASWNNLAVVSRLAQRLNDADRLYQQALRGWELARGWIERMELAPRARSSLFHMRLELNHRDKFARWALDEYFKQLPRGVAVTQNNRAEYCHYTGKRERARALYRSGLEQYETTSEAPARGADAIRRNLAVCQDAESGDAGMYIRYAVWAPALEQGFVAHAEREAWIIDLPPEFTDEGRLMAGLMCACLITQTRATELG